MPYDHQSIEKKWQDRWEDAGIFHADDNSDKEEFYCLIEFPYPSGAGLHIGHPRSNTAIDIIARKRRMEGYEVLYPIGWDAFGLPTENYAIKTGRQPQEVTKENIDTFRRQIKSLGFSFDWSREVNTTDPAYYKWTQWQFLQFFKAGLAYKDKRPINWCLDCKIGLANEEVVDKVCERCGGEVEKREKEQWMIAITKYADRLLEDLKELNYLDKIKKQQENWIGRSEGIDIRYDLDVDLSEYNFLGLHAFKDDSKSSFWPWLQKEVGNRGGQLTVLDLPNTEKPNIDEQVAFLKENYSFNEKTVIVTHSLGGVAAMKLLPELSHQIHKLVMVAPPVNTNLLDGKKRPELDNCCDWEFDFGAVKKNARQITVVADEHDTIVPIEHGREIAQKIGASFEVESASEPHYNAAVEPSLLRFVIPSVQVYTTRPDTNFGATFVAVAPDGQFVRDHIDVMPNKEDVLAYIKSAQDMKEFERIAEGRKKTGVDTGLFAINQLTGKKMPIYCADFVLGNVGTGSLVGVPGHDMRDFEFAQAMDLEIVRVVVGPDGDTSDITKPEQVQEESGTMVNSGFLDGMEIHAATEKIMDHMEEQGWGKRTVNYKLRDWVFSRQRYWGEPIPLVHCDGCGWVPVPDEDLPVELPVVEQYEPTDSGESPLASVEEWVNTTCPSCDGPAKRETDTMPNWAGSSWYFLRYIDPHNDKEFASMEKLKRWMPIDWYNGGMEHTTLHLLYSRFWNKFLFDQGLVPTSEPYAKRTSHGMILAEDGKKMSKSLGNVVNPDEVVAQYGADAARVYEMFIGPFGEAVPWSTNGLIGVRRFLEKVWNVSEKVGEGEDAELNRQLHKTIKKVTEDVEVLKMNTSVSSLMTLVNGMQSVDVVPRKTFEDFLRLLVVFAPHLANELWEKLENEGFVEEQAWPTFDAELAKDDLIELAIQVNGKLRGTIEISPDASEKDARSAAEGHENVQKWLKDADIKKVIYVQGRMLNYVI